jgi:glycerophosphoryl diester phosphodiesterase
MSTRTMCARNVSTRNVSTRTVSARVLTRIGGLATLVALATPFVVHAGASGATDHRRDEPYLAGRAVLPAETYAPGPPSGGGLVPAGQTETVINGVRFPTPSQPVAGISGLLPGRRPGEYLAMPDNGFGGKANSQDFLIRAYYVRPDFETARRGSGTVAVGRYIQFADPHHLIGFPIVRDGTAERWLTGGDIDPESVQRDHRGHLWVGDEFGPWILHFDGRGRLVEPPIAMPDGLVSPNNPHLTGPPTVSNSRGLEAMAMAPNGRDLVFVLEGAVPGDDATSRRIYRYDTRADEFTRLVDYRVEVAGHFVADAQAVSSHRLLVIERDGGSGLAADFRRVYEIDLRGSQGVATKELVVDLAAIPDPDLISLPPIHPGDIGIGDPFRVACESIEALHVASASRLVLGCDNNLPNTGRNPTRADDNELIVVKTPGR